MTLEHEIQALSDDEIINSLKCERLRMLAWVLTHTRKDCVERARAILNSERELLSNDDDAPASLVGRLDAVLAEFAQLETPEDASVLLREEAAYQAGEREALNGRG